MKIIRSYRKEEHIVDIKFNIHKFSDREKPEDKKKILIISCFSEFGCEVVGAMYCVPRILEENGDHYIIVMGWYGRAYLYQHLVDEFWEIKEEFQFLRDFSLAFHHSSRNLQKLEKYANKYGRVIPSSGLGTLAVGNRCRSCSNLWGQVENVRLCPKCGSEKIIKSLFGDVACWKNLMMPIPMPSEEKMKLAATYLQDNSVGVIARNRTTYGRNLPAEFYIRLLRLLKERGYNPIWLGEKQSTMECPVEGITDLSRRSEARDLELTLAIVKQLKFTVQFWTASTRLSSIVGTPFLIMETPDQIYGTGQEHYRMSLCTTGKRKLALCHYLDAAKDNDLVLKLIEKSIMEMENDNWEDVWGVSNQADWLKRSREKHLTRISR